MLMLGIATLFHVLWYLLVLELVTCLSSLFFLLLALWGSVAFSFLGLLHGIVGGVPYVGLMVSSLEVNIVAVWLGMVAYLCCNIES